MDTYSVTLVINIKAYSEENALYLAEDLVAVGLESSSFYRGRVEMVSPVEVTKHD